MKGQSAEIAPISTSPSKVKQSNLLEHNTHPDFDESGPIPETTITITSPPSSSHGELAGPLRRKRSSLNLKNNNNNGEGEREGGIGQLEPASDNEKEEPDSQRYKNFTI